jgi:hypothetical protein
MASFIVVAGRQLGTLGGTQKDRLFVSLGTLAIKTRQLTGVADGPNITAFGSMVL